MARRVSDVIPGGEVVRSDEASTEHGAPTLAAHSDLPAAGVVVAVADNALPLIIEGRVRRFPAKTFR